MKTYKKVASLERCEYNDMQNNFPQVVLMKEENKYYAISFIGEEIGNSEEIKTNIIYDGIEYTPKNFLKEFGFKAKFEIKNERHLMNF